MVEKDKAILMQSYDRLGQSGLDHSKDKFLVQSCTVDRAFAAKKDGDPQQMYDALTSMWNSVTQSGSSTPLQNKKLHVRHTVAAGTAGAGATATSTSRAAAPKLEKTSHSNTKDMTPDQLAAELTNLRRKYDELVSFSVNLTAERDILSNTLEQTKRDYNREMATRQALENKQGGGTTRGVRGGKQGSSIGSLFRLVVVGAALFVAGVKIGDAGYAPHLPVVGNFFVEEDVLVKLEAPPTPPVETEEL